MVLEDDLYNKYKNPSRFDKILYALLSAVEKPVIWFRETIVEPNRQEYYWYHERKRRVPTIDECYEDDYACQFEADEQFLRDRKVDMNILHILEKRVKLCEKENSYDKSLCNDMKEYYENASTNFFIKYGDMHFSAKALECYMKQKHRMAWERRHGPVGSGRKKTEDEFKIPKQS